MSNRDCCAKFPDFVVDRDARASNGNKTKGLNLPHKI